MMLSGEDEMVSWGQCVRSMTNAGNLVSRMTEYRLQKMMSIPEKVLKKVRAVTSKESFHPRKIISVSKPAANMAAWVMAVLEFHSTYQKHLPVLTAYAAQGRRVQISMRP